jgi:RHS repeat-associated protein
VWYSYAGQTNSSIVSDFTTGPATVARVLDDGSTQVYRYEYNSRGRKIKEIDPLGRETNYFYGTNNVVDPDQTTGTGLDLLQVKQKNGAGFDLIASYTYNTQHQPLTVTDASGQVTAYTYNAAGQLLTVTTPPRAGITENRTTTYSYDTNGYLQSVTGPATGDTVSYTYDGYGRVRTVTDSNGYTVTTDYDALDRQTRVTYPDGTYEETVYNRLDPEKHRDRLGRWSHTFYDALRRVVAIRDPLGRTTTQQWCSCGSLDKLIDANNNATTWERDAQGRVIREVLADGSATELTYENTTSRLKQRKDSRNQITGYEYFLADNLKQITYTNAVVATPNVSFTYDPVYNRLATMADGTGTATYNYNPIAVPPTLGAGRLATVDGPLANDTVSYAYDELGRTVSRGLSGFASTYAYDVLGRITTQGSALGNFTYVYDGHTARPLSLSYPNGQTTQYTYFPNTGDRRLQEIKHLAPGGGTISQYDYTYDAESNIKTWTQQVGASAAKVYELSYDPADQLTAATLKTTDPTPIVLKRYAYGYDPAGNRTADQLDDSVLSGTYNNRNQLSSKQAGGALLFRGTVNEPATVTVQGKPAQVAPDNRFEGAAEVTSGTNTVEVKATDPSGNLRTNTYQVGVSGSTTSYTYDANGNLTGDGTRTFEYDAANRLTRVLSGGSEVARFAYDGLSRRAQKIAGGVTTSYIYDADGVVEERPSSGATLKYLHGPGIDEHRAMQDSGGAVTYYLADHLGSIVQTTNTAGQVTLSREYDPYGKLLSGSASGGYAFTGREWDPDIGLYYYRARFYEPTLARFLSTDPLGIIGGTNPYAYVENAPTRFIDPTGLQLVVPGPPPPPDPPVGCSAGPWKFVRQGSESTEKDIWRQKQGPQPRLPAPQAPAFRGGGGGSATFCLCYYELAGRERITRVYSLFERTVCCSGQQYTEQRRMYGPENHKPIPIIMSNPPPMVVTRGGINLGGSCFCPPEP